MTAAISTRSCKEAPGQEGHHQELSVPEMNWKAIQHVHGQSVVRCSSDRAFTPLGLLEMLLQVRWHPALPNLGFNNFSCTVKQGLGFQGSSGVRGSFPKSS